MIWCHFIDEGKQAQWPEPSLTTTEQQPRIRAWVSLLGYLSATANTLSFLVLVGETSAKGCFSLYFLMMNMPQGTKVTRWETVQLSCPQSTSETEAADPRTVAIRYLSTLIFRTGVIGLA